ncbi:hypothetical protein BDV09DRAFT_200122 [Aspergillus tetrazonus]
MVQKEPITMPIAVVGMSCRFAGGATSPEKLWQLCAEGRSAWSKVPQSRFNQTAFYHPDGQRPGTSNAQGAHFLQEDVSLFDAPFFNFSAEVANSMDPQVRLQLEAVFDALESAGISIEKIAGTQTSVFAGASFRDYHDSLMRDPDNLPRFFLTGNGAAMISNRISHFYDLRGPSMTVDTGCSTALTALHLACQSLRAGESTTSIVAGSNIMLNPDMFETLASVGFLSSAGKSYAFDDRASGYGRGEGIATVILKPLADALRDGDPIRSVIRETALNQDGRTPTLTSPSEQAQEELILSCYRNAGLDPTETTYVEAHGTGTRVGDPIEISALSRALNRDRPANEPLFVGSVKSNIGHAETASGLASIIKVTMAFEKESVPPNANYQNPNPGIDLESLNVEIPSSLKPWPSSLCRRASVNNFGYGGTNAHVIMEPPPQDRSEPYTNGHHSGANVPRVFVLSAKDETGTHKMMAHLAQYLRQANVEKDEELMKNLAFTLGQRRSRFQWTAVYPAVDSDSLVQALERNQFLVGRASQTPRIGMVFTGQGAQWYAMGRELIEAYPVFKEAIQEADKHIRSFGSTWSLIEELTRDEQSTKVNTAIHSLPICTALQLALVRLLRSWNINPTAVTGHSSGEVAAAYAAGAIEFRSALAIGYFRGSLTRGSQEKFGLSRGGMLAAGLGKEGADAYLARVTSGKVVVACINSPTSVTISGDVKGIEELEALLVADKVFARRLKVDAAYHSHHMEPFADEYAALLRKTVRQEGEFGGVLYSSPVTGNTIEWASEVSCAEHWVKNMVQPVLFSDSLSNMCRDPNGSQYVDTLIEVGPHGALAGPIRQTLSLDVFKGMQIAYTTCLTRGQDAVKTMQSLACTLINQGYPVDLNAVNFPRSRHGLRVLSDLPSYPWNHSQSYWVEPRINKTRRLRAEGARGILGLPTWSGDNSALTWRSIVRLSDFPWIRDHKVQSDVVFPGAGYVSMAIEAIAQSQRSADGTISGFKLKEVEILKALVVPDTMEGVEINLCLRPCSDRVLSGKEWREFAVSSISNDGTPAIHCRGLVSALLEGSNSRPALLPDSSSAGDHEQFSAASTVYTRDIKPMELYTTLQRHGIHHGPVFQNLVSISCGQSCSLSELKVVDTASLAPLQQEHNYVIHPVTLDNVLQSAYTPLLGQGMQVSSAMVPRSIKEIYICSEINSAPGHLFKSRSSLERASGQGFEASVAVVDNADEACARRLEITGLYCQSLGNALQKADVDETEPAFCVKWAPDLDLTPKTTLKKSMQFPVDPAEVDIVQDIRRACFHFVHNALASLTETDILQFEWHQNHFYKWMKSVVEATGANALGPKSAAWFNATSDEQALVFKRVQTSSTDGEMVCRVGFQLLQILRNEVAPLQLMLEDDLLYRYYAEAVKWQRSYHQAQEVIRLFTHKNPRANILEVGGGTGGCTKVVLDALGGGGDSKENLRFAHYTFTDISPAFFKAASEKFEAWGDLISYQKLDIEQDPETQAFECGGYDLVIACQVLHATKSMPETLTNVKKLLKPGGQLLLIEFTRNELDLSLIFGVLPGWWLNERSEQNLSPSLTVDAWESVLGSTGFGGLDLEVHDCEGEDFYVLSVMLATASEDETVLVGPSISILYDTPPPQDWLSGLTQAINGLCGVEPQVGHLSDAIVDDRVCIVLTEMDRTFLTAPTSEDLDVLRRLATRSKGILWLSRGGAMECENPHASLSAGLFRTLRAEFTSKTLVTLDLDPREELWDSSTVRTISVVLEKAFNQLHDHQAVDSEYARRDGTVLIPRLFSVSPVYQTARGRGLAKLDESQPFFLNDRELRLGVGTAGLLDTLAFSVQPAAGTLPDDWVEIKPQAFGLNFRDLMVALGQLETDIMGYECSGEITRCGSAVPSDQLNVGDRACAFLRGHYSNVVRVHWTSVQRIPNDMTYEVAASVPMAFTTAYFALYNTANLQNQEKVLIHSAAGGVGQAAVMLAQRVGAEVFVSVGSKEKQEFMQQTYGIPADHIVSSRDASFASDIMSKTQGRGVDVVLNSLGGELLQASFDCLATFGRFVEIGKRDLELNNHLEMQTFKKNVSFSSVDLILLGTQRGPVFARVLADVLRLFAEGALQPVKPLDVHPIADLEKAFRLMQTGKHMGKIVLVPGEDDHVKVLPQKWSSQLDPKATYLVVGGLGGIGKSICRWMVERGARSFILLTRSAKTRAKSVAYIDELKASGCVVAAPCCDIANLVELKAVITACSEFMSPIRGIIHCGMVLRDSIFERMSLDDYNAAIRPKVQGTWNLHQLFADAKLDFFVMLSSLAGVAGNVSQANYSAGGSFQDAVARHRSARGLPGVALDLGLVKSVGYVAENEGMIPRLQRLGFNALEEKEVLRLVESALEHPLRQGTDSQIVTGLRTNLTGQAVADAFWSNDRRFTGVAQVHTSQTASRSSRYDTADLKSQLASASSSEDQVGILTVAIARKLSDMFLVPAEEISPDHSLTRYGVDSLVAVELRNWLASSTGTDPSIFEIMQSSSLKDLAARTCEKL